MTSFLKDVISFFEQVYDARPNGCSSGRAIMMSVEIGLGTKNKNPLLSKWVLLAANS